MPLCEVHPFFGLLVKELSELEASYAHDQDADTSPILSFANDFEAIVRDAKPLIEVCLDDRYKPDYSTAERYREAHYDALLHFDDMRYGELATEEVMLDSSAYDSAYNYSVEMLRLLCTARIIVVCVIIVEWFILLLKFFSLWHCCLPVCLKCFIQCI